MATVTRVCKRPECGNSFTIPKGQRNVYCSRACVPHAGHVPQAPKACSSCDREFLPRTAHQLHCGDCVRSKGDTARIRRYGVTRAQWDAMVAQYDGKCWLCKARRATTVDHDHATGEVRGALCRICNMALHFVEHPDWLAKARKYLSERRFDHCGKT